MNRIKASVLGVLLGVTADKLDVRRYRREWETDIDLEITTAYPTCICIHRSYGTPPNGPL